VLLRSPGRLKEEWHGGHDGDRTANRRRFFFDDFNEGTAARWEPMGGIWSVVDGQYEGQETEGHCCMGFAPNQSIIRDVQARDVDVEAI